jgi:hypothetical protein
MVVAQVCHGNHVNKLQILTNIVLYKVLSLGAAVCIGLETRWGLGKHVWTVEEEDLVPYFKAFYASIIIYNQGTNLVKISILVQYKRLFVGDRMQCFCNVSLSFLSAWAVTLTFLLSLSCLPVQKNWYLDMDGYCVDKMPVWYTLAMVNIVTDIALLVAPMPVIRSLHLPPRQKLMLSLVFLLGVLCVNLHPKCLILVVDVLTRLFLARLPSLSTD